MVDARVGAVPFTQEQLDGFAAACNGGEILQYLGFHLAFPRGEVVEMSIDPVKRHHCGGMGTSALNGAVVAGLIDFAVGYTTLISPPMHRSGTVQLSMTFERPVRGPKVRCIARVTKQAKSILFVSAEVIGGDDVVGARASGMVALGAPITLEEWTRAFAADGAYVTPHVKPESP